MCPSAVQPFIICWKFICIGNAGGSHLCHIASYSLTTYFKDAGPQLLSVLRSPNSPEPGTVNWGVSLEPGVASARNYPCSFRIYLIIDARVRLKCWSEDFKETKFRSPPEAIPIHYYIFGWWFLVDVFSNLYSISNIGNPTSLRLSYKNIDPAEVASWRWTWITAASMKLQSQAWRGGGLDISASPNEGNPPSKSHWKG